MEIYVGSTNPIKHKVFWRGEPTDATSNPIVTVYDVSNDPVFPTSPNAAIYTNLTTEKVESEIGVYQLNLPPEATERSRDLNLVWSYNVAGSQQTRSHKLYVVKPYVDFAQAYDSIDFGNDPSDPNYKTYSEFTAAERYARKLIENYTGQMFDQYTDTFSIYGTDSDSLVLPAKLINLYSLYSNDILLKDTVNDIDNWNYQVDITESGFGIRINRAGMMDNTVYTANGMVPPSIHDSSGVFQRGIRYTIFGKFGYDYVPDQVELACIELIKDYFSKDKMWRNKYVQKISTFDWDFEYGSEATAGTGNLYADRLLEDFIVSKAMLI